MGHLNRKSWLWVIAGLVLSSSVGMDAFAYCKGKKIVRVKDMANRMATVHGSDRDCTSEREPAREWVVREIGKSEVKRKIATANCGVPDQDNRSKSVVVYARTWGKDNTTLGDREVQTITVDCTSVAQAAGASVTCPASIKTAALSAEGWTAQLDGAGIEIVEFKKANIYDGKLYCMYGGVGGYRVFKPLPGTECSLRGKDTAYCARASGAGASSATAGRSAQ